MRIVSLLPSATEITCGLDLRDSLVGVSHECDFPDTVNELPRITRSMIPASASSSEIDALVREQLHTEPALYSLDQPLLKSLQPDLIVTQTLCEVCAVSQSAVQRAILGLPSKPKIINLEPNRLVDLYTGIRQVAQAANCPENAEHYIAQLQRRASVVAARSAEASSRPRVLILEWIDPLFSAGHWNPELVQFAGGHEMIGKAGQPSVTISWQQLLAAAPEILVISCCGFSVNRALQDLHLLELHPQWSSLPCVQNKRVFVVDGSAYFSRPGPRLIDSLELLAYLIHPQLHPLPERLQAAYHQI